MLNFRVFDSDGEVGMSKGQTVYDQTYQEYLRRLQMIDLVVTAKKLGGAVEPDRIMIPFYGTPYYIGADGITDAQGNRPNLAICVVLGNYLLRCPDRLPTRTEWTSFRDFKDAAPLVHAFSENAEKGMARHFGGRLDALVAATRKIGGTKPADALSYDLCRVFWALPKIPVLLLFNDADEEFSAQCSILFERRVEQHIDMESLSIIGWNLKDILVLADS